MSAVILPLALAPLARAGFVAPPPVIYSGTAVTTGVGNYYLYQISATNNPISFSANGLPDGLSCDSSTGMISGYPTTSGVKSVELVASNGAASGTSTLVMNIQAKLTVTVSGSGSVDLAGTTYHDDGETLILTATSSADSWGVAWWGNLGSAPGFASMLGTSGTLSITAHNSMAISADFSAFTIGQPIPLPTSTITVDASRGGTVFPSGTNSWLLGFSYSFLATPAPGYLFEYWLRRSGSSVNPTVVYGNNVVLKVAGDEEWTAEFAPWRDYAGAYCGVFSGTAGQYSGKLMLKVNRQGAYSGSLLIDGERHSFSGTLGDRIVLDIHRPHQPLRRLEVAMDLSGLVPKFAGYLTAYTSENPSDLSQEIAWSQPVSAELMSSYRGASPCPQAGYYTAALYSSTDNQVATAGSGFLTLRVSDSGKVQMRGLLADGTPFTTSSWVTLAGDIPLFAKLYGNKGSLLGAISGSAYGQGNFSLSGDLRWDKPPTSSRSRFPAGFLTSLSVEGGAYQPRITFSGSSGTLGFSEGNLSFSEPFTLEQNGGLSLSLPSVHSVTFHLDRRSGVFFGKFNDGTGRRSYQGVVLQSQNCGAGFFLDAQASGSVLLNMMP